MSVALPVPALLFCPGHRPDRFAKAADRADVVVLDLEDAVPTADKDAARAALAATPLDPGRTVVRINATGTDAQAADLAALRQTGYRFVMLAKAESAAQVTALADWQVVALCETPLGILNAAAIAAAANTAALMWGSEDLMASLGGRSSRAPDGTLRGVAQIARSTVLLAAKAHGRQAIDSVWTDFADVDGLARETSDAAASGFDLKACIHPNQVPVVVDGFRPSDEQLAWAARVSGAPSSGGVTSVDGQMIDAPVLAQAAAILRWKERA